MESFSGAKVALLVDGKLLLIQRDDIPGLRYAGLWDFPGGAREAQESPIECALRETKEELGIILNPKSKLWQSKHPAMHDPSLTAYFMVWEIGREDINSIHFGDEGQGWKLTSISEFMKAKDVVVPLKARLQSYLDSKSISGSNAESS